MLKNCSYHFLFLVVFLRTPLPLWFLMAFIQPALLWMLLMSSLFPYSEIILLAVSEKKLTCIHNIAFAKCLYILLHWIGKLILAGFYTSPELIWITEVPDYPQVVLPGGNRMTWKHSDSFLFICLQSSRGIPFSSTLCACYFRFFFSFFSFSLSFTKTNVFIDQT